MLISKVSDMSNDNDRVETVGILNRPQYHMLQNGRN